jgi:hypothetical protein
MRAVSCCAISCCVVLLLGLGGAPAGAQFVSPPGAPALPNPESRIPAPLPPPQPPPTINGPLSQSPPAGVYTPPRLDTHSDRTTRCLQQGSSAGLSGPDLDAYTGACVNGQ